MLRLSDAIPSLVVAGTDTIVYSPASPIDSSTTVITAFPTSTLSFSFTNRAPATVSRGQADVVMLEMDATVDVGEVRIGVAVTDPLRIIAQPHSVITRSVLDEDVAAIAKLVSDLGVIRIVAGLPLDQNGQRGPQAEKVLAFVEALRPVVNIEIVTQDERFSTAASERMLIQSSMRRKDRKKVIDKAAAQYILQAYMDRARQ